MATSPQRFSEAFARMTRDRRSAGSREASRPAGAAARRKPLFRFQFLLRFSGVFVLRFADRQFLPLLFQLPPRITRALAKAVTG